MPLKTINLKHETRRQKYDVMPEWHVVESDVVKRIKEPHQLIMDYQ